MSNQLKPKYYLKLFPSWAKPYDLAQMIDNFDKLKKEVLFNQLDDVGVYHITYIKTWYDNKKYYYYDLIMPRYSFKYKKTGYIIRRYSVLENEYIKDIKNNNMITIATNIADGRRICQTNEMYFNFNQLEKDLELKDKSISNLNVRKINSTIQQLTAIVHSSELDLLYKIFSKQHYIMNMVMDDFDAESGVMFFSMPITDLKINIL